MTEASSPPSGATGAPTASASASNPSSAKQKKLLMVIPVATDQFNQLAAQYVSSVLAPDFALDVQSLSKGLEHIQGRWSLAENAHEVVRLISAVASGYDGIFVSDFDRAGVEPARELVGIPIIGGFEPQALMALAVAQSFSIITVADSLIALDKTHPRLFGIADALASVRAIPLGVQELGDTAKVVDLVWQQSQAAVHEDGAQAIVLGCTALLGIAPRVAKRFEQTGPVVPVTDPNLTGVAFLQALVRCGLGQSGITYPQLPADMAESHWRRSEAASPA